MIVEASLLIDPPKINKRQKSLRRKKPSKKKEKQQKIN